MDETHLALTQGHVVSHLYPLILPCCEILLCSKEMRKILLLELNEPNILVMLGRETTIMWIHRIVIAPLSGSQEVLANLAIV